MRRKPSPRPVGGGTKRTYGYVWGAFTRVNRCRHCNQYFSPTANQHYCQPCMQHRWPFVSKANSVVSRAVAKGSLPPVQWRFCYDCGDRAQVYDHRDYTKPLDVEPVCRACNVFRGAGYVPGQVA